MIDARAKPLDAAYPTARVVPVTARTAMVFNGLAVGAAALAALLPLGVVGYWAVAGMADVAQSMGFVPEVMPVFDPVMRAGAIVLSLLPVLPLSWALLRLRTCFGEFAQGRPFAARGIAGLRDFATGVMIGTVAKPISFTLLSLLLSWHAPAGRHQLAIRLDSDTLIMALFAATIASLGWAMQKAAAIAEENSQFI
jgi:hypothetical protein